MSDEYDYKYDSLEDPYVYPGTQILRNKFGIKHQDLLSELESQITDSKFVKSIGLERFANKGSSVRGNPSSALPL